MCIRDSHESKPRDSLKTEMVMTMNLRSWRNFLRLRTSKASHPQCRDCLLYTSFEGCVEDLWGIQIVFGRRNTFGPLHQFPREQPYVEPASFLTEGNNWSGKYVLYEQGMLEKPEVKVIKPH